MTEAAPPDRILRPPSSVMAVLRFVSGLAARRRLDREVVAESWEREPIGCSDAQGFLDWLHIARLSKPPIDLHPRAPERDLRKSEPPLDSANERGVEILEREVQPIDVNLWQMIVRDAPSARRARSVAVTGNGNKGRSNHGETTTFWEASFWGGAQMARGESQGPVAGTQFVPVFIGSDREKVDPALSPPAGLPGFQGRQAAIWSGEMVGGREPAPTLWNEPVRKDVLPLLAGSPTQLRTGLEEQPAPGADALYGQVTLIAPAMTVPAQNGIGVKFDWRDVATSVGPVDESSFTTLASAMPPGARALYPAMDPRSLTRGAVNLRLAPSMIQNLVAMGYGSPRHVDAFASNQAAQNYYGGTPPIRRLPTQLVPVPESTQGPSGTSPASEPSRRMRFIDYLGFPIYLSPSLNVQPDLDQQMYANVSTEFLPRAPLMSPLSFAGLRQRLFGGFTGIEARPSGLAPRSTVPGFVPTAIRPQRPASGSPSVSGRSLPQVGRTSMQTPMMPQVRPTSFTSQGTRGTGRIGPTAVGLPQTAAAVPFTGVSQPLTATQPFTPVLPGPRIGSPAPGPMPASIPSFSTPMMQAGSSIPGGHSAASPTKLTVQPILSQPAAKAGPVMSRAMPARQSPPGKGQAASTTHAPTTPSTSKVPATMPLMTPSARGGSPTVPVAHHSPSLSRRQPDVHATSTSPSVRHSPQMVVASSPPKSEQTTEPLAVQTAVPGAHASNAPESPERAPRVAGDQKQAGLPGSEVNLLANEVWSILKRRLAFEAQRMGRQG